MIKISTLKSPLAYAFISAVCFSTLSAGAVNSPGIDAYFAKTRSSVKAVRPYHGPKSWSLEALKEMPAQVSTRGAQYGEFEPASVMKGLRYYDYLECPDGSYWFYTVDYDIEKIEHSEWYTEEIINGYTFHIFDAKFNEIGTIKDKITLGENETKAVSVVLDPSVSFKFFNADDKPEVMVYLAFNTNEYKNIYYNKVYSIGGEKDAEGNDVSFFSVKGRCVDVVNAAAPGQPENYYYTFVGDEQSEDLDADYGNLVDFINSYFMSLTVYASAKDNKGPQEVYSKKIYMTRIPGDTTDGIYFISKPMDGTAYFILSQYEKPYFIDPLGGAENEDPTPDNSLLIDVVALNGVNVSEVSSTKIPVVQEVVPNQLMYSFYSIGSVAWKHDVDMVVNGSKTAPAFLVARDVMNAATYEETVSNYAVYGTDGKLIKEISDDTDGIVVFDPASGAEPDALFVNVSDKGYTFAVKGLYSGKQYFTLDQNNNDDPISASCNRMLMKDGSYKYCFEMTYYDTDDAGNDYIRVAWFNQDGSFDRIDKINMGKDVMAGAVNLYSDSLNPYLYDNDDAMEYAVLVKRMSGQTTRNEFLVVDDNGEWFKQFTDNDGYGDLYNFTVLPGNPANIMLVYRDDEDFNVVFYALPFIGDNQGPDAGVDSIISTDEEVSFFDLQGRKVTTPSSGLYIRKQGNTATKVLIK